MIGFEASRKLSRAVLTRQYLFVSEYSLGQPTSPLLTAVQRESCAKAIGEDVLRTARAVAEWPFEFSSTPIRVWESGLADDVDSLWVSTQIRQFHLKQLAFANEDYSDPRWLGRSLRARASGLLRDANEMASLGTFMHEFDPNSSVSLFAQWIAAFVRSAGTLVVLVATNDDDERLRHTASLQQAWKEAFVGYETLKRMVPIWRNDYDRRDLALELFGVAPEVPITSRGHVPRAYPGGPGRWAALAGPQLRLLLPSIAVPVEDVDNMVALALKLGGSRMPLFANRVGNLVGSLIYRASQRDFDATGRLLKDFLWKQSARIIAAGGEYHDKLSSADESPGGLYILDAYKAITEGVLRPYGSLLVRLGEISEGSHSGEFFAFPTLGALERALGSSTDELVILARIGLAAELRNERAHENAFVSGTGTAATVLADGSIAEIDLSDVSWRCTILRSFLDGVDVAVNVASAAIGDRSTWRPPASRPPVSLRLLEYVVANLAARLTDGSVESLGISGDTATIVYEGTHRRGQLDLLAAAARQVFDPGITTLSITDGEGSELLTVGP